MCYNFFNSLSNSCHKIIKYTRQAIRRAPITTKAQICGIVISCVVSISLDCVTCVVCDEVAAGVGM